MAYPPPAPCQVDTWSFEGPDYIRAHMDGTTAYARTLTTIIGENAAAAGREFLLQWAAFLDELGTWHRANRDAFYPGTGVFIDSQRYRCQIDGFRNALEQRTGKTIPSVRPPDDAPMVDIKGAASAVAPIVFVLAGVYALSKVS